jgi:uncharacterized protein
MAPTAPSERYASLDILRGFAILGILIMNIQSYSMIEAAYINPAAYGDLTGLNKWIWILSHVLVEQKFLSIFSILFGAGIVLFTERIESRGRSARSLHYRRTLWLLVIGLAHAYLLWHGDILVSYALCALAVYQFRKASPKTLVIVGLILFSISSCIYIMGGLSMANWSPEMIEGLMASWKPGPEKVAEELAVYGGSWLHQMSHRFPSSFNFQTFIFLIWTGWRAGGLMLLGMALYKWGVLTAHRTRRFYLWFTGIGLGIGWPIVILGVVFNFKAGWSLEYSMFLGSQFNYWGSLLVAMGYIGLVMMISKSMEQKKIIRPVAAVGRMALTQYLLQTLICTFLFYGHGLGLFGRVERQYQILIVFAIWGVQLILSPIWLRHFRFGPVEWLWRSLTYLKRQPMRYSGTQGQRT